MTRSRRKCCVIGCRNNQSRNPELHFYCFPGRAWELGRKQKWIESVRRDVLIDEYGKPWVPNKNNRICSVHFLGGVKSNDPLNPAFNPTIFPEIYKSTNNSKFVLATKRLRAKETLTSSNINKGCADEKQECLAIPSASSSSGHGTIKTYARKRSSFSADKDLKTPSFKANIKAKRSQGICRTCLRTTDVENMNSITSPEANLSDTIKQKFAACIPEVALEITSDAQICGYCAAALHWAYEFRKNCLKTEEIIHNYVNEVGGDAHIVDLDQLLNWTNLKTLQKLKSVEIVSETASTDWNAEKTCVNNDGNVDLNSVTDEIVIKEEPLLDEYEMSEIVRLEVTNAVHRCDIKIEEIEVKQEPLFVDVGKLNEEDELGMESITTIGEEVIIQKPPIRNIENPHTCKICQTNFSLKCDLRLHVILHADNKPPYACDACEFISPDKIILRRHLISHTKEFKFKCKVCEARMNDLDDHDVQTCLKNKLGGASTAKKSKLEESTKTNSNIFVSTPLMCKEISEIDMNYYRCNICRESFTEKVHLIQHLNTHNNHFEKSA